MILITGATGTNGTEILKRLATADVQVRAMVRNLARASVIALPDVEVVEGDFDRPETLLAALAGVERAFLLTSSSEHAESQQIAFIDAARQSGIAHIVKLSQFDADVNAPGRFQRYHAMVEAALQASGLAYTILRARCAAAATAKVVSSTRPTASSPMGLRFSFRSRGEVKKADE